jgi:hypothetical protein
MFGLNQLIGAFFVYTNDCDFTGRRTLRTAPSVYSRRQVFQGNYRMQQDGQVNGRKDQLRRFVDGSKSWKVRLA